MLIMEQVQLLLPSGQVVVVRGIGAVMVGRGALVAAAEELLDILPHKRAAPVVVEYWFCSLTEQPQLF